MKSHVEFAWKYSGTGGGTGTDPYVRHFSRDQTLDTCGSCHARRTELTGDFAPGDSFFDHYMLDGVDGSETFFPDGQVRDEDYEFSAFLGSRMYAAGVRCVDCHDPHSGKTLLTGNALCMRCHVGAYPKAPIIDPATHTFHKHDSAGAQCISCHMPTTTYMQRHGRHDHGFTTPDPLLTRELGIPNACNRCHADKDAGWAVAAAERWYGAKLNRPARRRARTIAAARRGAESSRAELLALLNDPAQAAYWKSASARLLGAWAAEPAARAALLAQLSSAEPLVRIASARALAPLGSRDEVVSQALERSLSDHSRAVRIAAAGALANALDPRSPVGLEYARFLAQQADQPTGQLQQATYLLAQHRDADEIVAHFRKSVAWDARSGAMRREVALAYGALDRPADAAAQLEQACQIEPANADYPYLLGLTYSELGQPDQAAAALARAVQLDPRHARAWYDLGLARRNLGQVQAALDAIRQAESIDPNEPDYPYARATILAQSGRRDEARAAARRALDIRPDDARARQLIEALDGP
jgi:predicted CXXCH cytochrome family protein